MATKTVTNVSSKVLQLDDLGNILDYSNKYWAQSCNVQVGGNKVLQVTDAVNASIVKGDIYKFVNAGMATVA